jgi:TRAP-type C4-dicarboxylate transport system permease small subunit
MALETGLPRVALVASVTAGIEAALNNRLRANGRLCGLATQGVTLLTRASVVALYGVAAGWRTVPEWAREVLSVVIVLGAPRGWK